MKPTLAHLILLSAAVALACSANACRKPDDSRGSAASVQTAKTPKYHCPMHPTYVSDKPGDCPICGMKLVPIKEDKVPAKSAASTNATVFTCPMHPNVVSNAPGLCPECNMKLWPKAKVRPIRFHDMRHTTASLLTMAGANPAAV